jgi:hypothetical protein
MKYRVQHGAEAGGDVLKFARLHHFGGNIPSKVFGIVPSPCTANRSIHTALCRQELRYVVRSLAFIEAQGKEAALLVQRVAKPERAGLQLRPARAERIRRYAKHQHARALQPFLNLRRDAVAGLDLFLIQPHTHAVLFQSCGQFTHNRLVLGAVAQEDVKFELLGHTSIIMEAGRISKKIESGLFEELCERRGSVLNHRASPLNIKDFRRDFGGGSRNRTHESRRPRAKMPVF